MTTAEKIAAWKERQAQRCEKWIHGRQCDQYRMEGKRYCAIHYRP